MSRTGTCSLAYALDPAKWRHALERREAGQPDSVRVIGDARVAAIWPLPDGSTGPLPTRLTAAHTDALQAGLKAGRADGVGGFRNTVDFHKSASGFVLNVLPEEQKLQVIAGVAKALQDHLAAVANTRLEGGADRAFILGVGWVQVGTLSQPLAPQLHFDLYLANRGVEVLPPGAHSPPRVLTVQNAQAVWWREAPVFNAIGQKALADELRKLGVQVELVGGKAVVPEALLPKCAQEGLSPTAAALKQLEAGGRSSGSPGAKQFQNWALRNDARLALVEGAGPHTTLAEVKAAQEARIEESLVKAKDPRTLGDLRAQALERLAAPPPPPNAQAAKLQALAAVLAVGDTHHRPMTGPRLEAAMIRACVPVACTLQDAKAQAKAAREKPKHAGLEKFEAARRATGEAVELFARPAQKAAYERSQAARATATVERLWAERKATAADRAKDRPLTDKVRVAAKKVARDTNRGAKKIMAKVMARGPGAGWTAARLGSCLRDFAQRLVAKDPPRLWRITAGAETDFWIRQHSKMSRKDAHRAGLARLVKSDEGFNLAKKVERGTEAYRAARWRARVRSGTEVVVDNTSGLLTPACRAWLTKITKRDGATVRVIEPPDPAEAKEARRADLQDRLHEKGRQPGRGRTPRRPKAPDRSPPPPPPPPPLDKSR